MSDESEVATKEQEQQLTKTKKEIANILQRKIDHWEKTTGKKAVNSSKG